MDPVTLIALITAVAQASKALAPVIEAALKVAGSDDEAAIKAALAELQGANESIFPRVQDKLRG